VWVKGECHEASNKKSIDVAYIPYARVQEFLEGEKRPMYSNGMEHPQEHACTKRCPKPTI